jgi:hypothetical protein
VESGPALILRTLDKHLTGLESAVVPAELSEVFIGSKARVLALFGRGQ